MKLEFPLIVGVMLVAFAVAQCPKNDTSEEVSNSEENDNIKGNSKERMLEWFYPPAPVTQEDDGECPANASCPLSSNPLRCSNSEQCPLGQRCCKACDFIGKCCVPAADSDESSSDSDESSTDSDESSTDSDENSTDSGETLSDIGERSTAKVKTT